GVAVALSVVDGNIVEAGGLQSGQQAGVATAAADREDFGIRWGLGVWGKAGRDDLDGRALGGGGAATQQQKPDGGGSPGEPRGRTPTPRGPTGVVALRGHGPLLLSACGLRGEGDTSVSSENQE